MSRWYDDYLSVCYFRWEKFRFTTKINQHSDQTNHIFSEHFLDAYLMGSVTQFHYLSSPLDQNGFI